MHCDTQRDIKRILWLDSNAIQSLYYAYRLLRMREQFNSFNRRNAPISLQRVQVLKPRGMHSNVWRFGSSRSANSSLRIWEDSPLHRRSCIYNSNIVYNDEAVQSVPYNIILGYKSETIKRMASKFIKIRPTSFN